MRSDIQGRSSRTHTRHSDRIIPKPPMTKTLSIALVSTCLFALLVALLVAAVPSTNPQEAARLNNIGVAYMNQQLFDKALKAFDAAAAKDPALEVATVNRGVALLNLQRIDEAKALLEKALKDNPKDVHAWYNLGLYYKNSADASAAVAAFRHVIEIDPNDADTWYFLGSTYAQLKHVPEAIVAFASALKIDPLHASAQFGLARAYQQSGQADPAHEAMKKFQYITQNKLGAPISLAYGEQGKYSRAEESPVAVEKVAAAIPVRLVDVTKEAGLKSKTTSAAKDLGSFLGAGACFLDYDADGKIDIFLVDNGPGGGIVLYHNMGDGKFEDVTSKSGLDPSLHAISCTAGDFDNDGAADLAVALSDGIRLLHNEKNGTFKDVTEASGLKNDGANLGITFVDYDHDGDLDLFITRTLRNAPSPATGQPIALPSGLEFPGNVMCRNNGNGTFTDVTMAAGLSADPSVSSVGSDYNNDRAIDLVVTDIKGPSIFANPREGKFSTPDVGLSLFSRLPMGIAVLDFNHDSWMDLALTNGASPNGVTALALWRNDQGKHFKKVPLPETNWTRAFGVTAIDYDNDGWVDLVAVGETKDGKGEVRLFRNLGADGFKDVTADVGLDKIQLKEPRSIITGDYDGDGATDLLITQNHGPAVLLRNVGGNQNHWLRLSLKGLADNKSAIGTKVEVLAGGNRQKFEIAGSNGYLGQNSTDIVVGLGNAKEADIVRMLWPTGVLQDEIQVAGDKEQKFLEIDRRGSSCPTLFVWNGERYEFVADMLGAGVVGHWVGPGQRDVPRPVEYIKIDSNAIREKDGKLSFRFMEPLEEAVYLDQVRLLAVDHPADE